VITPDGCVTSNSAWQVAQPSARYLATACPAADPVPTTRCPTDRYRSRYPAGLALYAKGLTTCEISAHFAEIYGTSVSKEAVGRITGKAIEEMTDWRSRPLDSVCAACGARLLDLAWAASRVGIIAE
jgi:Transposase, Mutator family